jgi:hypothetical protein
MALAAGVCEELLFRGVLQQYGAGYIGAVPSLIVTSLLFGLAHNPVPGASSLVEAVYGATFGALYLASGGNIFVPIVSHVLYDLATFVEVRFRATGRHSVLSAGGAPSSISAGVNGRSAGGDTELDRKVKSIIASYRLNTAFVKNAVAVFKRLDSDGNSSIDRNELQLGIRTFGKFTGEDEINKIFNNADTNSDGEITFDEFLILLVKNALQVQKLQGKKA